jgi:ribosome-associated toxin RatA of RatAB toxin-antitoxin module
MADQTQGSIEINADARAIMDVIEDYPAYPEWANQIKKVEVRKRDSKKRGSEVYYEVSQGPLKADYVLSYAYKPNDAGVSWTFVEGHNMRDLVGEYTLEPAGGTTKVTYKAKVDTPIPMLGFMKRQIERQVIDTALKGLKKRVESL